MKYTLAFTLLVTLLFPTQLFAMEKLFYYFENTYGVESFEDNHKSIDIVAPQIYEIDDSLRVSSAKTKTILKAAKKKKAAVMPLLVNKGFDKVLMSTILITPKAQDDIIRFMIREAKKNKYVGWQFDFENINHMDRDLYTAFVKKTYEALKKENLQLSVAVVVRDKPYDPLSTNQDWSGAYDYGALAKHSDFLTLMSYDEPYSTGPVASLPFVKRTLNYILTEVPAEKISLGIPLYCWKWTNGVREGSTSYDAARKAYSAAPRATRWNYFDSISGTQFFRYMTGDLQTVTWCDNEKSYELKMDLIKQYGLRGYSAWALGQESDEMWSVLGRD